MRPEEKKNQAHDPYSNVIDLEDITHNPDKMGNFQILPVDVVAYLLTYIQEPKDFKSLSLTNTFFKAVTQKLPSYNYWKEELPKLKKRKDVKQTYQWVLDDTEIREAWFPNILPNATAEQIITIISNKPEEEQKAARQFFNRAERFYRLPELCSPSILFITGLLMIMTLFGSLATLIAGIYKGNDSLAITGGTLFASLFLLCCTFFSSSNYFLDQSRNPFYNLKFDDENMNDKEPLLPEKRNLP